MVAIVSEEYDKTTDIVIEWLHYFKTKYSRFNSFDRNDLSIGLSDKKNFLQICNSEVDKIWIRRGRFQFIPTDLRYGVFSNYLKKEEGPLLEYCEEILRDDNIIIGSYIEEIFNNKILNLHIAKKCGLSIPETLITNNKSDLLNLIQRHKKIITKSIFLPPNIKLDTDYKISSRGTTIIKKKQIELMEETIAPTLVQEYIEKQFEVRVFFFLNKFYSMAIFSQRDRKTLIDFRNYNKTKPNRFVPFVLPSDVLNKIKSFIKKKRIKSGSIDLIFTKKEEFVFLEINPQGQFNWVSENCNYYIEKEIAEMLSDKKNNGKN